METLSLFPDELSFQPKSSLEIDRVPPLAYQPLAYQLAPKSFDAYVGQSHLIAPDKPLRRLIESDKLVSMVIWGPPGCGKTSLSRLIASISQAYYVELNAVTSKIADIKSTAEAARMRLAKGKRTLLFIDEIHRFNKTQQDALLPEVENGTVTFIGATTENPFFSVIPSLLSRSQVFELHALTHDELLQLVRKGQQVVQIDHPGFSFSDSQAERLIQASAGDARRLLNLVEMTRALIGPDASLSEETFHQAVGNAAPGYSDNDHYNVVSAFIKSMRGSDPDAALYWLARMLKGGEDPMFIARRMVIFASEDIGNADPQALSLAVAAMQAAQWIGMPEIRINLAQVVSYLASAPKSNASYTAINEAMKIIDNGLIYEVPLHLKSSGGSGYVYPHDQPEGIAHQSYLPQPHTFYKPKPSGFESEVIKRLRVIAIQKQHFLDQGK